MSDIVSEAVIRMRICSCRTIHNIGELQQGSVSVAFAQEGSILPTSPGGADSINEATIASFDPIVVKMQGSYIVGA